MVPWRAAEGPLFEYACHEGNYSMKNILSSSRAAEGRPNVAVPDRSPVGPAPGADVKTNP